jgi:hypothetical protein
MTTETIEWHAVADKMPDSDQTVLVQAPDVDEPIWLGFHDGELWVSVDLVPYEEGQVIAWAELPRGKDNQAGMHK